MGKLRKISLYLMLAAMVSMVGTLGADSLDIDDDQEILTFASKRGAKTPQLVSLSQADRMIKKGYIQTEVNFLIYDENKDKLQSVYRKAVASGGQKYTINVRGHNQSLYFYAYRVDTNKKVEKLFPSGYEKFYTKNPIRKYVNYTLPLEETKWLTFGNRKGVENFYFFASKQPIKKLDGKNVSLQTLNTLLTDYSGKSYNASVNQKKEVKVKYQVYPNTVWFKKVYAEKVVVVNQG